MRIGDIDVWAVLDGHMTVAQPPGFPDEDDAADQQPVDGAGALGPPRQCHEDGAVDQEELERADQLP